MKKIFLLSLLAISTSLCFSQSSKKWRGSYLLNGYLKNSSVKEVTLQYTADSKLGIISDTLTAAVANGKFSFSGFIDEPFLATLLINESQINFFIDPNIIDLTVEDDNQTFDIKGSVTSNEYLEIEALKKGFTKVNELELTKLLEKQNNVSLADIDQTNKLHIRIANLEAQHDLAALTFSAKEKSSFAVLYEMNSLLDPSHKYYKKEVCAQLLRIYSLMPESLKDTPTGVNVSGKLLMASMNLKF